jgi:cation diffusion facilitator family transporter
MSNRTLFNPKRCIEISLFVNIVLTAFKFIAGIFGLSKAMLADALHSLSDILTSAVAYAGVCIGQRPADEDHPYGHGNAETIAATSVSVIILGFGAYAGFSAIQAIIQQRAQPPLNIALIAAIVSILVKEALFRYTIKVGRISNNPAVVADAWHHRSDAYSSVAALVGIAGAKIAFVYLDPIAGVVVSVLIVNIAIRLIRSNIGIIMDERPQAELISKIKSLIHSVPGVKNIDSIRVHRRGSRYTIDLEIAVDSKISVEVGHKIAAAVRIELLKKVQNIGDVMVHVNPYRPGG